MTRLESLREDALNKPFDLHQFYYLYHSHLSSLPSPDSYPAYAAAFSHALSHLTPAISDGELIVGRVARASDCFTPEQWQQYREDILPIARTRSARAGGGQDSHMAIDYERLLQKGLIGIRSDIDTYLQSAREDQIPFYKACQACLDAVITYSEHYADEAERQAACAPDPARACELSEIARICRRVPKHPASSFHEAIQSVHFVTHCITLYPYRLGPLQFQLGHPDRYLLPYYEADLASGRITKEQAQLLLDCLAIQINVRVPNGLSSGYMVGGRDREGKVVLNDLTYMGMQVIDDIRLVYPSVGLCYTEEMGQEPLRFACEILSHGRSHPAIFNDDIITKGLRLYGVDEAQSHDYIHSTCVEITPTAASGVWVASPYTNMAQMLLDTMDREYESFEEHLATLLDNLTHRIAHNFEIEASTRRYRAEHCKNPLLSCFVRDCLETGTDIEAGGARYNWIMPSFVGIANLVDSLYALKTVVYEERSLTIAAFKAILDANFEGHEALRERLLTKIPKYGNDNDPIDALVTRITSHIVAACRTHKTEYSHGYLVPSVFCWIMHEQFGRETGATPDGRVAGFPLGDGSGPCQGREFSGPTASIRSATKWDHAPLIGGVAVNMKFAKSALGPQSLSVMEALIRAYLARGGFEIQINVTDRKTLLDAMEHPDAHRDLVVRIGGYSDYFVKLSREMQSELLLRTEHTI